MSSPPFPSGRWLIGSSPECNVVMKGAAISGRHCVLSQSGEGFTLEDVGSTNGTFVNSHRLEPGQPVHVSPQDTVTLGRNTAFPWSEIPLNSSSAGADPKPSSKKPGVITIGRAPTCDQVLDFPMISWEHARLTQEPSGRLWIEDLGSSNGTFLNTRDRRITSQEVKATDELFFGSYGVTVSRLLNPRNLGRDTTAGAIDFRGDSMEIGRDPSAECPIKSPVVSWRHARLTRANGQISLEDLGSRNGTFVDGKRISGKVTLVPGQEISLGSFHFVLLDAGGRLARKDYAGNFTIEASQVVVEIAGGRRLLDPISFSIYPQELVALMGPAGAGKTTLLKALNGYTPLGAANGQVLFNNADLNVHFDSFRLVMGYVPQDDIMHAQLTVREALYFTARLRTDMSDAEIQQRIVQVLADLDIADIVDREIGSPEKKVLSGGQRKRVNIAMELLSDPDVLFLDEPTSGLSSYDADQVISLLRKLADSGKTIIATIHQPSLDIFKKFDNLLMVGRDPGNTPGALVYYGPAFPESIEFLNPNGVQLDRSAGREPAPELLLSGLKSDTCGQWVSKYGRSSFQKEFVADRAGNAPSNAAKAQPAKIQRSFNLVQLLPLFRRNLILKSRDKMQTILMFIQAPLFGFLLSLAFTQGDRVPVFSLFQDWNKFASRIGSVYFLCVVAVIWFGCNNAARDIVGEWSVYTRERMVNLKIPSYVLSKLSVLGLMCMVQCAMLLAIVYPTAGLEGPILQIFGVLFLASMVGAALGLLISAVVESTESAIMLLPIVLLPMIVMGGGIKPIHEMGPIVQKASYIIPSRWAFEASFVLEAGKRRETYELKDCEQPLEAQRSACNLALKKVPGAPQLESTPLNGVETDIAKGAFPEDRRHTFGDAMRMMSGMFLVLLTAVLLVLKRRDIR